MMDQKITIPLTNQISEIERVSDIVNQIGGQHDLSGEVLFAMNLALEEILINVIKHGYKDDNEHEIIVRLSLENGELTAEVEDDGIAFNPLDAPTPDINAPLEERPIGGLGIHLTRTMMDRTEYRREDNRNILTVSKKTV
ncbi:MAG TPA: ATP-binding protein [Blastocatellia bacterium]|nr:ATP-binding protein [Blastocatellia bacterium]